MPKFDRTGPLGLGPRRGRAGGVCAKSPGVCGHSGYEATDNPPYSGYPFYKMPFNALLFGAGRGGFPWGGGRGGVFGGGRGGRPRR